MKKFLNLACIGLFLLQAQKSSAQCEIVQDKNIFNSINYQRVKATISDNTNLYHIVSEENSLLSIYKTNTLSNLTDKTITQFSEISKPTVLGNDIYKLENTFQPNESQGIDAIVCNRTDLKNNNFGNNDYLLATGWTGNSVGSPNQDWRMLINFPLLDNIGTGPLENKYLLTLYRTPSPYYDHYSNNESRIYPLIQNWNEQLVTWNNQPQYDTSSFVNIPMQTTSMDSVVIDLTPLISKLKSEGKTNFGFLLKVKNEVEYRSLIFGSSNFSNAAKRPKLEIFKKTSENTKALYFLAENSLWKYDNNVISAVKTGSGNSAPVNFLMASDNKLFYATSDSLYINYQGITKQIKLPASTTVKNLFVHNNEIFLATERHLWKIYNNTIIINTNDNLLKEFPANAGTAFSFTPLGNKLAFIVGFDLKGELFITDGTAKGTSIVVKINPSGRSLVSQLTNMNGHLYFNAGDGVNGLELWKSDGTKNGTSLVKNIHTSGSSNPTNLTVVNNQLYFSAITLELGYELWKSNGTTEGTVLVKDILPGANYSNPSNFLSYNNKLIFVANIGGKNFELCFSDGTAIGTKVTKDLTPGTGSYPDQLTIVAGNLYFIAKTNSTNPFWKSNGTFAGTVPFIVNPSTESASNNHKSFVVVGGNLFFSASNAKGTELWKKDAQSKTKELVKDINLSGNSDPANLINLNNILYFTADNNINGRELWKSDGTLEGTMLVADISPGASSSNLSLFTLVDSTIYFVATNITSGTELWKTNGSAEGTSLVAKFGTDSIPVVIPAMINFKSSLYFIADKKLYKSDGTSSGTVLVSESASFSKPMGVAGDHLVFVGTESIHGTELWHSDGTTDGTKIMKDLRPGPLSIWTPGYFLADKNSLFFGANDHRYGEYNTQDHLWKTDGTAEGTILVVDLGPQQIFENYKDMYPLVVMNDTTLIYGIQTWDGSMSVVNDLYKKITNTASEILSYSVNILTNSNKINVVVINNALYFVKGLYDLETRAFYGDDIYKYSNNQSTLYKNIVAGQEGDLFPTAELINFSNSLYIAGSPTEEQRELFNCVSDDMQLKQGQDLLVESVDETMLSPIPVTNLLNIQSKKGLIELNIVNGMGVVIFKKENQATVNNLDLDVNYLAQGMYYLKLKYVDGTTATKKFVKN